MPKLIKKTGLSIVLLVLCSVVLISIQLSKKASRVPSTASANLHQKHIIDQEVRLLIVGDMGSPNEQQQQVSQAMENRCIEFKPNALVFLGDNFYHGGVSSVNDPKWQTNLLNFYQGSCLAGVKIYAILGNHDYEGNAQAQVDFTDISDRWVMPYRYYDVEFGNLLSMTAIDPWFSDYCFFASNCMTNFMLDSLSLNKDKVWNITIGHYPFNSISSNRRGKHTGSWIGKILERLLCNGGNDVYFSGHAHHLEHRLSNTCDMELVVSGAGGGGSEYGIDDSRIKEAHFASAVLGFTELVADKQQLNVSYFNTSGDNLYEFSRSKPTSNTY